jgi:hypothetical protein
MPIIIKISDTVTAEQRLDPRFQQFLKDSESFWNDPLRCTDDFKLMLGLHEAGHAYFARRSGATNIRFYGPTIHWDSRPQYDCPAISRSSCGWTPAIGGSVVDHVKARIGGFICRRELSGFPNDQIAIDMDLRGARQCFDEYIGTGDEAFKAALQDAERGILEDLRSPTVILEIWAEARRVVREIFPAPKLTSAILKARRLGWG